MGNSALRNARKIFTVPGTDSTIPIRITNLENNVYKITYYEIVSGTNGSLAVPSQATINADEFGLSGNTILSKIDGFNKPTFQSPTTSTGVVVTTSLNTTTGAWAVSGAYTDAFVAVIYSINIKAVYYSNLTYSKIIETVDTGVAHLDSPNFTGIPTAPTAAPGTNTNQIATAAFVTASSAALTLQQVLTNNPSTGNLDITSPSTTSALSVLDTNISIRSIYVGINAATKTNIILDPDSTTGQSYISYGNGMYLKIAPLITSINHTTAIFITAPKIEVSQDPTTALGIATRQFVLANVPSVPVTSVFGRTGTVIAVSGDYTTALVAETTNLYYTQTRFDTAFTAKSTTNLTEGTNLYFTNPRSIASTLTSYVSGAGAVSSADSIISAIQKLNGNIALVSGAIVYQGLWNASTNTPTLVSGVGTKGTMYKVSVAGTTTIDGISQWNVGDQIMFDGTTWDKLDGIATEVLSVNGAVGAVTLTTANVSEVTNLYFTTARAITALTGQSNALFTNGAGYLVTNQTITLSGDVTGSGTIAITTAISNTVVTGKLITGYVSGAGTISAADSILQAINKLNGNMAAAITGVSSVNALTGAVTLTTANIADSTNKRYQTDLQQTYNDATSSIQTQLNGKQPTGSYEVTTNKDASNGYAGLTLFKINFKNVLNTITSFFTNSNTASRTYTFPDKDITVAGLVDITGVNSGTNTGDNATNTQYVNDYRLANFVAGTNYLAPNGSAAALTSFPTFNQNTTGTASTITGAITESQVTNLVSDLALKAPLLSPALTGIPTAPTATVGTNTTQLATTAFVLANPATGTNFKETFTVTGTTQTTTKAYTFIYSLLRNNLSQMEGIDYTFSGTTITFLTLTPLSSDVIHIIGKY